MFENYPDILDFHTVCGLLQVSRPVLYNLLLTGEIAGFKTGKRGWKIPKSNLINYINSHCSGK